MGGYTVPMYGIFTYIYHKNQPHVGQNTMHGMGLFNGDSPNGMKVIGMQMPIAIKKF